MFNPALARVLLEQPAPAQRAASVGRLVSALQQAALPPEERNRRRTVRVPGAAMGARPNGLAALGIRPNALYALEGAGAPREKALALMEAH